MKIFFSIICLTMLLVSCGTLTSNTSIKPNDSFILGNNKHGAFKVKLENVSKNDIEVYKAPIDGGRHSLQVVKPNDKVTVNVDKNTALFIQNKSNDTASVNLKVSGDVNLSMGYKN